MIENKKLKRILKVEHGYFEKWVDDLIYYKNNDMLPKEFYWVRNYTFDVLVQNYKMFLAAYENKSSEQVWKFADKIGNRFIEKLNLRDIDTKWLIENLTDDADWDENEFGDYHLSDTVDVYEFFIKAYLKAFLEERTESIQGK